MIINSEIIYVCDKLCDLYFLTGSLDKGLDLLENKFEALQKSKQSYSKTYIYIYLLLYIIVIMRNYYFYYHIIQWNLPLMKSH